MKHAPIYNEERFRTPLAHERDLGLWVDRIGWRQADASKPDRFRVLGQYAAVAVESGSGILETGSRVSREVKAGDVILIFPREAARYYPTGKWDTRWVVWNGPEACVLDRLCGLNLETPVVRGGGAAVAAAWQQLNPVMDQQNVSAILRRKLALLELIRELSLLVQTSRGVDTSPFLGKALRELINAGGKPAPLSIVAKRLHVSPAHFRRVFKSQTGSSPKVFQTAQRMTKAKELLAKGCPIKETSDQLGFTDVFHFMRLFRKVTGQTAGQFALGFAPRTQAHAG